MKKLLYWIVAVLMVFTLSITAFATNETSDGNIKIEVVTDKGSYGATEVAEITATITNVSGEDINNVTALVVFDDLAPVGKRTSETSKNADVIKVGESISFKYKATLNAKEHKLNIIQKIILWFVRLFNGGYNVNNSIDVITECVTEIDFGKFIAKNVIQVHYEKVLPGIPDNNYRDFEDIRKSIESIDNAQDVLAILEAYKKSGHIKDYQENENYVTFETESGIHGIWENEAAIFNSEYKSVPLAGKSNRIDNTRYEKIIEQASSMSVYNSLGDVAVIRPYSSTDFKYDDFITTGEIIADALGVDIDRFDDNNVTLSVLKSLDEYSIIWVDSHGTLINGEPYICLTQTYNNQEVSSSDLEYIFVNQNNQLRVHSSFFENNYEDNAFDECLVFLGTCYSMYDESFSATLMGKGVECVYGYTDRVTIDYCNDTLVECLLKNMLLDGDTSNLAYDDTMNVCESADPYSYFYMHPLSDFSLYKTDGIGIVEGIVSEETSRNPISGVEVYAIASNGKETSTITDKNGRYALKLSYGDYSISFVHDNYEKSEMQLTVNNDSYTQNITLQPKEIDGTVIALGVCGVNDTNATWVLYKNGKLVIAGSGDIADYDAYNIDAPWVEYNDGIVMVEIENGITRIGSQAFYNCPNIKSIIIGADVTSIGKMAFALCTNLTSLAISDGVKNIEESAFALCINLTNVTLGNSVAVIGESAFYGCKKLSSIEMPPTITTIGKDAFRDCTSLSAVNYKGSQEQWNDIDIVNDGNDYLIKAYNS